jgi:hypothetical protein
MRHGGDWLKDPNLWEHATERQRTFIEAVIKHKTMGKAAEELGIRTSVISEALKCARDRAAAMGHAPGHWDSGVAPGYRMGKVTVARAHHADGSAVVERTWERQHPEAAAIVEYLRDFVEGLKEEVPAAIPAAVPAVVSDELCTQYTITDYHFGMQAHASEGDGIGADWNLEIAEDLLVRAISYLAAKAPDSGTAILGLLGDLVHFDGPDPVTPTHRHPLDSAGRQRTVVRTTSRALKRVIAILLQRHAKVVVVVVEGNHDLSSTPWVREILLDHYASEPRVEVLDCDLPYQAVEFGATMIGFTHGHKRRKETLPALFTAMFRAMFGRTKTLVIHTGHLHSGDEKDFPGGRLVQHRTMTAPDSHALRGGWFSEREMATFHYHRRFGPQGRDTVTPEMLAA